MSKRIGIIGSGPAAHTAAIYAARGDMDTTVFEGAMANGIAPGGQLTTTTDVENFPGFPDHGIMGPELCERFRKQSVNMGAKILTLTVTRVDFSQRPFTLWTSNGAEHKFDAVIVATGAYAKTLEIPGKDRLWNSGISACAVCDGALPIFRRKPLVVVGGGDTAMEEALFLAKYGSEVFIVHRRAEFRASAAMQHKVHDNPKIKIIWNSSVTEAFGETRLSSVKIETVTPAGTEVKTLDCAGLFFAIGHTPATAFLGGQLELDETGYVRANNTLTSVEGVFACGDVQDKVYRQAITAAGSGCQAALEAMRWLD